MPLRVAIDGANFARDRRGMGRLARTILRTAAEDARYEVTLLADRPRDVRILRADFPSIDVRSSWSARRGERYDVAWFPFNGMRFSVAVPALVLVHDVFAFTQPHARRVARFREQAPIRRAAREASRIATVSHWSRLEIARELAIPRERIEVVVSAPDPFWFPAVGDVLPEPLEGKRYALVVGASEPRKNVRLAIAACARALRGERELLVVVGTLSAADRAYARASGVRAGEIAASDMLLRALYRRATVVLVPSFAEAFGFVAVEALACGAPVLAAHAAALPETTAGAATLVDPRDEDAWTREIRRLFDDDAEAAAARARGVAAFACADRSAPPRRMLALLDEVARGDART